MKKDLKCKEDILSRTSKGYLTVAASQKRREEASPGMQTVWD